MTKKRILTPFRRKYLRFRISEARRKVKQQAVQYKGGACQNCGYSKCVGALVFHHLNPEEKDFGLSHGGNYKKFEDIKSELDKCILLCSNCHAEAHHSENEIIRSQLISEIEIEKRKPKHSGIVQLVEQSAVNRSAAGSSPAP